MFKRRIIGALCLLVAFAAAPEALAARSDPTEGAAPERVTSALVATGAPEERAREQVSMLTPADLEVLGANPGMLRVGGDNVERVDDAAIVAAAIAGSVIVGVFLVAIFS